MTKEELIQYKEKLSKLSEKEKTERDLYLRQLANGEIEGPLVGHASIDKTWLKYYTEDAIKSSLPNVSAYEFLYSKNINNMDRPALDYYGRKITYREMFDNIDICAKALKEYNVKEGDIVSISLPNVPEAAYLFYAISKIGAVANMIDPRTSVEGIEEYLNEVNSKVLFMIDVANPKILNVKNKTKVDTVINVSPADSLPLPLYCGYKIKSAIENVKNKKAKTPDDFIKWSSFYEDGKKSNVELNRVDDPENKPVLIVHTGGTTGSPKGVMLSNRNINAIPYQSMLFPTDLQNKHKWLNIMPPFIAYGIGTGLHFPLSIGMEDVLIPAFDPNEFDKLLLKYKPNHIAGVPSHWDNIINSKKLKNADLSFLITCVVGGDTMDKKLEKASNEFLKKHGCNYEIAKGYGMTEVNGSIGRTTNTNNVIGSVGIPFAQTNVKICNPDDFDEEYGYNQPGEIYISGPSMMLEYYNNPDETNNTKIKDANGVEWIKTGDRGYIGEDANMFICDRIKRIIVRHDGFKVFPSMIEDVIDTCPMVKMSKVVGMPDVNNVQGELPCVYIILKDDLADINEVESTINTLCQSKLPEYAIPQRIEIVKEFPLTPVGKVDTMKLKEELLTKLSRENNIQKKLKK